MKEIEIKLKYTNEQEFRDKIKELNATFKEKYEIVDCYFAKEGETMKDSKKLLRVRTQKGKSELTYKGKRETESEVWERVEINIPIEEPEKMYLVLENLGFVRILKNKTLREYWDIGGTELGIINIVEPAKVDFVEIEGPTTESVENLTASFKDILKPLEKDHFKPLDEANK